MTGSSYEERFGNYRNYPPEFNPVTPRTREERLADQEEVKRLAKAAAEG